MKIIRPASITDAGSFTRASTGTYYDYLGVLQYAAVDTPRFDHNPAQLSKGPTLLIEPAATNLTIRSQEFDNAAWTKSGSTIVTDSIAAPDGTVTADKIVESLATSGHGCYQLISKAASEITYTYSQYVKAAGRTTLELRLEGGTTGYCFVAFDLTLGEVTNAATTGGFFYLSSGITNVGNGWYKCRVTAISNTNTGVYATTYITNGGLSSYAGDGGSGVYVWGSQIETGVVATSYIPTTTTQVTRAADINTAMLVSNIPENDFPTWVSTALYPVGTKVLDLATHKIYSSTVGVTGTAVLAAATPGKVTMPGVVLPVTGTPIRFTTAGTLPTQVVAGTTYYVLTVTATDFTISATLGGAALTFGANSGTHTATASSNINKPVTDTSVWLDNGADNRWRMFDTSITSQTTQAGGIYVALSPGARFDSLVGLNVSAESVTVNLVDSELGTVYHTSQALISDSGIVDWYRYFYEPIIELTDFIVDDIPVGFASGTLTVAIAGTSPAIGGLVLGLAKEVGDTEANCKIGTVDYSVKTRDAFGNYVVTPRAFSKRADYTIKIASTSVDSLQALLATYRSTPVVYVGNNVGSEEQYRSTIIYGFYKDFSIDISYPPYATCTMQVEGLT